MPSVPEAPPQPRLYHGSPQSDWLPDSRHCPGGVMKEEGPVQADQPSLLSPGTTINRK